MFLRHFGDLVDPSLSIDSSTTSKELRKSGQGELSTSREINLNQSGGQTQAQGQAQGQGAKPEEKKKRNMADSFLLVLVVFFGALILNQYL